MTLLESQLKASVDYNSERQRQQLEQWLSANCVKPGALPTEEQLLAAHIRLDVYLTTVPLPMPVEPGDWTDDDKTEPNLAAWQEVTT